MERLTPKLLSVLNDNHIRSLAWMEQSNADVLVHSTEVPHGYVVPQHSHRRTQVLCVSAGVVLVATARGRWLIPPGSVDAWRTPRRLLGASERAAAAIGAVA